MKESFSERLKKAIGKKSVRSFAQECEISEATIRHYLTGNSEPTRTKLVKIAEVGTVSIAWLVAGEGPMRKEENEEARQERAFEGSLAEWVLEEKEKNPNFYANFSTDCAAFFPSFSEWLKKRRNR